jgi:hypothetical protein
VSIGNPDGILPVSKWLKWTYKQISNNDFMDSLVKLEEAMEEENQSVRNFTEYWKQL